MALSGIKANKCFGDVPGLKYKGQHTQTIPANTTASNPTTLTINDNDITVNDVIIVTLLGTHSTTAFNGVAFEAYVIGGTAVIMFINPTNADVTIDFNVVVI